MPKPAGSGSTWTVSLIADFCVAPPPSSLAEAMRSTTWGEAADVDRRGSGARLRLWRGILPVVVQVKEFSPTEPGQLQETIEQIEGGVADFVAGQAVGQFHFQGDRTAAVGDADVVDVKPVLTSSSRGKVGLVVMEVEVPDRLRRLRLWSTPMTPRAVRAVNSATRRRLIVASSGCCWLSVAWRAWASSSLHSAPCGAPCACGSWPASWRWACCLSRRRCRSPAPVPLARPRACPGRPPADRAWVAVGTRSRRRSGRHRGGCSRLGRPGCIGSGR